MHPLRLLLYGSLVLAIAVAWAFGAALLRADVPPSGAAVLAVTAFIAFMLPWAGAWLWSFRRASDLNELNERARAMAKGATDRPIADRAYHGELDDLARAIEESRLAYVRLRGELETHRAVMDEIVASLGEGLIAVTPQRRVAFANRRAAEMFGITDALVGRSVVEVVRKQSVVSALDRALEGEATSERMTLGAGDDERQVEVRAFPALASPEVAAVALFIDVSRIARLQRVRKDFLDDFSHEVRTPLAGLKSAAETLEAGGLTPEHETQLLHVMQRQIGRLERLSTDLAELNQIESGEIVLQPRVVALRPFLEELSEGYGAAVRGDASAAIDAERAQQIFTNLLDNARKHGGAGGAVTIELSAEEGQAVVRVSDEGPGIPAQELERIFNRFYRVDRSRSQPGTGLGLAIAKHLVVAHGGTIRAVSGPGRGATFEVRLPAGLT